MNNLKHYRTRAGLTQAALAERVGISPRTLQDYEQGKKPLEGARAITVLNMARALGCTVEDLIDTHDQIVDRSTYASVQKKIKEKETEKDSPQKAIYKRHAPTFRGATLPAPPPLGYKWQDGKLVVDEEEAAVVKRAEEEMAKDGQLSPSTYMDLAATWEKHFTRRGE